VPDETALLARMVRVNAELRSYQADLHVAIAMHSFPYLSPTLDGTAYYERPDKNAIVFNTVPALADAFKKVYPQIDPPSAWPSLYTITPLADDGTIATFRLVKKTGGRVSHLDVKVDDRTATIVSETWNYKDGGFVTLDQQYETVGGNFLIKSQSGKVELPSYQADVTSAFSNYKINVPLDDRIFTS
jgi:hypothetical protein